MEIKMRKKRSSTIRRKFLAKRGLKKTPRGKEVAHKKALVLGGKDDSRNLMLKKKLVHQKETKILMKKLAKRRKIGGDNYVK